MEFEQSITKQELFSILSQEEIFSKYLGISISFNKKVINPLRGDRFPTVSFKWFGDSLLMSDHSGWFTGDCVSLVMKINYCSYQDALQIIYRDFNLNEFKRTIVNFIKTPKVQEVQVFRTYTQKLTESDLKWWNEYKVSPEGLKKYHVSRLREAHVGKYNYYYNSSDPAFHYKVYDLEGNFKEKMYYYNRTEYRFMSNMEKNSWFVQGFAQLPENSNYLVITKSLKDVICMNEFNIPAIALHSESTMLYQPVLDNLKSRFENIVINMDYDYAGIKMMNKYKRQGFRNLVYFKDLINVKDFADFCKVHNVETIKNYIKNLKNAHN